MPKVIDNFHQFWKLLKKVLFKIRRKTDPQKYTVNLKWNCAAPENTRKWKTTKETNCFVSKMILGFFKELQNHWSDKAWRHWLVRLTFPEELVVELDEGEEVPPLWQFMHFLAVASLELVGESWGLFRGLESNWRLRKCKGVCVSSSVLQFLQLSSSSSLGVGISLMLDEVWDLDLDENLEDFLLLMLSLLLGLLFSLVGSL